jgi:hypothetical protein
MYDFMVHPQPTAELLWVFKWMVHLWVNELWFIHNPQMSDNGFSIDGALMGEVSLWFVHNPQLNYYGFSMDDALMGG